MFYFLAVSHNVHKRRAFMGYFKRGVIVKTRVKFEKRVVNVNDIETHCITFHRNSSLISERRCSPLCNVLCFVFFALHKMNKGRINFTYVSAD